MPDRKGRRRRPHDRRRDERRAAAEAHGDAPRVAPPPARAVASPRAPQRRAAAAPAPSPTARATGFIIAVVTAFLAILLIRDAFVGDRATPDVVARIVAGAFLVAMAAFIGALLLFPSWFRERWRR